MPLRESEAYKRLRAVARQVDPALKVERSSVHWREEPSRGIAFTLIRGTARALLFMPAADIEPRGWEDRLRPRLEAARRYLGGFTVAAR
jgi:hypothetical protein